MNSMPKRINGNWLQQKSNWLACTVQTINGQPNPNYLSLKAEIEEAEAEIARWRAFESWVKANLHMILNAYPLRTGGQTFDAGQVFFNKDKATGVVTHVTRQEAWERYQSAQGK